jgi:ribosomal protein S18 acetylase RimI-like enzyme
MILLNKKEEAMESRVTVRTYRSEDQDRVKQCIIELQNFERDLEADRVEGEEVVERNFQELQEAHDQNTGRIFVAEVEEEVVGFVNVRFEHENQMYHSSLVDYAYISDIVVLQAYRGRGIGTMLLQQAEDFARQQGGAVLKIEVLARNQQAADVYQHAGFRPYEIVLLKHLI